MPANRASSLSLPATCSLVNPPEKEARPTLMDADRDEGMVDLCRQECYACPWTRVDQHRLRVSSTGVRNAHYPVCKSPVSVWRRAEPESFLEAKCLPHLIHVMRQQAAAGLSLWLVSLGSRDSRQAAPSEGILSSLEVAPKSSNAILIAMQRMRRKNTIFRAGHRPHHRSALMMLTWTPFPRPAEGRGQGGRPYFRHATLPKAPRICPPVRIPRCSAARSPNSTTSRRCDQEHDRPSPPHRPASLVHTSAHALTARQGRPFSVIVWLSS